MRETETLPLQNRYFWLLAAARSRFLNLSNLIPLKEREKKEQKENGDLAPDPSLSWHHTPGKCGEIRAGLGLVWW